MISPPRLDELTALTRAWLDEEVEAGFPRLGLIPSSDTVKFLDHFATLAEPEQEALLQARARSVAAGFFVHVQAMAITDAATQRYRQAVMSPRYRMGMRYSGLRMAKAMLNDQTSMTMLAQTRAGLDFTPRDDPPAALVPDPDFARITPARAPLLRKLIDGAFKDLFAVEKSARPGGETVHTGPFEGTPIAVSVDYASRMGQLRYWVAIPDETEAIYAARVSYEGLWAAGQAWDT